MEIGHKYINDILVINLFGELYCEQAMILEYQLQEFYANNKVIINCEELDYIDSKGLGILVKFKKLLSEKGGKLAICAVSGKVKKVFDLTHFETVIQVYETLKEAIEGFKE
ncbi:MAG: STAS domain-containing protein [Candidatus Cloacimonetes bacterium]|nr:STAS domain-containing protein [Candidatus Cloacimonadota bacterium]